MKNKYDDLNSTYVKEVFTENTGGGCMVDCVVLSNGKILGITDDCVCLYKSYKSFVEQEDIGNVPTIHLV